MWQHLLHNAFVRNSGDFRSTIHWFCLNHRKTGDIEQKHLFSIEIFWDIRIFNTCGLQSSLGMKWKRPPQSWITHEDWTYWLLQLGTYRCSNFLPVPARQTTRGRVGGNRGGMRKMTWRMRRMPEGRMLRACWMTAWAMTSAHHLPSPGYFWLHLNFSSFLLHPRDGSQKGELAGLSLHTLIHIQIIIWPKNELN